MVTAVISTVVLAGCDDDAEKGAGSGRPRATLPASTAPATPSPSSKKHTADDLKNALIPIPSNTTSSVSDSGTYDKSYGKAGLGVYVESASMLDKPQCAVVVGLDRKLFGRSPSAYVAYTQGAEGTMETLTGMSELLAARTAGLRTPPGCESIRVKDDHVSIKVVSDKPTDIGKGGRIKQVDVTMNGSLTHTWSVSFYGAGFLGGYEVVVAHDTESDVLAQARQAYQKATAALG